jgi:hypothetical protein
MGDFQLGSYTVQQRWDKMLGVDAHPIVFWSRVAWFAFACFTASDPTTSYYIAPHLWVIGVLVYYWYPT